MKKENYSTQYDLDFLEKVFSYLKNYEKLEIDCNDMYQFSTKEKQALMRLKEIYSKVTLLRDYQTETLEKFSIEEALSKANSFLIEVFSKREKEILELDNLIIFDDISIYESGLSYRLKKENISFEKILIPNNGTNYTTSIIVHEKMHALTLKNIDLQDLFRNGLELLPIFLARMLLYSTEDYMSKTLEQIVRINDTRKAYHLLEYMKNIKNNPNKSLLDEYVCTYINTSTYDYILGELYSSLLMKYYLLDKDQMIKKLNQVLNQKLSISDFLNSYQVGLLNKELIPTIKEETDKCKRISIIP